jgi:hypothetical protein
MMGIVQPQRDILKATCPQFREDDAARRGELLLCGGSGFAIMSPNNFEDWRFSVAGRMKMKQILDAFADCPEPETKNTSVPPAPTARLSSGTCSRYYGVWEKSGILYGLVSRNSLSTP